MNDGIAELAGELDADRIRRARMTPIEQKLLAGGELFDAVRQRMIWGIRSQFPEYDESQVYTEYMRRLDISRKLERSANE